MSERNAYTTFRNNVLRPGDRIDRIENLVGIGFPDTNGCFNGIEFWMEVKAPREPARPGTALFSQNHPLSVDQRNWFLRQRRARGLGFIYIDTNKRRMLVDGCHADAVNSLTVQELVCVALWVANKPTPKEAWNDLREFIARHG